MVKERMNRVFVAAALVGFALPAFAAPGDHIRTGDTTITPSVMTGVEAHSNLYLSDGGAKAPEIGALAWVLKPKLGIDVKARSVLFSFGAGYELKKFVDFSTTDNFHPENADHLADFDVDGALTLFPTSKVGARLDDHFENEAIPAELPTETGNGTANVVHTGNDLSGGVVIRPGSALTVNVLGQLGFDNYVVPHELTVDDAAVGASFNNRLQYGPMVDASYKFLPKTSLVANFSYNFLRWDRNLIEALGPDVEGSDIGSYIGKPDADAWRANVGITGQFTQKLAASAQLGYGHMEYDEDTVLADPLASGLDNSSAELSVVGAESFATDTSVGDGVLVNLQVSYAPTKGHTLTLGYRKDFQDAVFTNYVAYNYVFFRYEGTFQNRLGLGGELSYRLDTFHGEVARGDQNLLARVSGSYKITPYLSTGLSGSWTRRACAQADCEGTYYSTQYDDFAGTLGLTFTY